MSLLQSWVTWDLGDSFINISCTKSQIIVELIENLPFPPWNFTLWVYWFWFFSPVVYNNRILFLYTIYPTVLRFQFCCQYVFPVISDISVMSLLSWVFVHILVNQRSSLSLHSHSFMTSLNATLNTWLWQVILHFFWSHL